MSQGEGRSCRISSAAHVGDAVRGVRIGYVVSTWWKAFPTVRLRQNRAFCQENNAIARPIPIRNGARFRSRFQPESVPEMRPELGWFRAWNRARICPRKGPERVHGFDQYLIDF